jgi:transposase
MFQFKTHSFRSFRSNRILYRRLQAVPGIGEVTARTLVAALPELGHLSNKQIS